MANWDNVFQSLREMWLPAGGVLAVIIIIAIIFSTLKKRAR